MKPILIKLHNDHENFIRLFSFLEKQCHMLEECDHCDLRSILDAIIYMKEYVEFAHHPLESIVFKYFLKHHEKTHEKIIDVLQHEHDVMPTLTENLIRMLNDALADSPQKREVLCYDLKKYISTQIEHMELEEEHIYPSLRSTLNENEWKEIDNEFVCMNDPLFGKNTEKKYLGLFQKIIS